MPFLWENKVKNEHQYGFVLGKSTSQAVFEAVKYLYDNIKKDNLCGSIFMDMAFDSVYHLRPFLKLEYFGLFFKWFASYLERSQRHPPRTRSRTNWRLPVVTCDWLQACLFSTAIFHTLPICRA